MRLILRIRQSVGIRRFRIRGLQTTITRFHGFHRGARVTGHLNLRYHVNPTLRRMTQNRYIVICRVIATAMGIGRVRARAVGGRQHGQRIGVVSAAGTHLRQFR